MLTIEQLLISAGHNFVGHHGGPAGSHAITSVDTIECVAGQGVRGDRFFGHQPDYKGQITFFAAEVLDALRTELDAHHATAAALRRNVVTRGADLNQLIGQRFEVQGVQFLGVEECRPCYWMDQAIAAGANHWLRGRGGLRARILTDGWLRCDSDFASTHTSAAMASSCG